MSSLSASVPPDSAAPPDEGRGITDGPERSPIAGEASGAVADALFRVARAVMFGADKDTGLEELPLSQVRCLRVIGHHEGLKMQDLAARMDVKLPALSQVVDRLAKRGLVERRTDVEDRRVVRLHLAAEARAMVEAKRRNREERLAAAVAELDPGGVDLVIEGLRMLAEAGERAQAKARAAREEAERLSDGDETESYGEMLDRQESERRRFREDV